MKNKYLYICIVVLSLQFGNAQVGMTGNNPDKSAALDLNATNKGLLIPRVALTKTIVASPITSPATSLLVYNTVTVNDVTPGYYNWDGAKWVRFAYNTDLTNDWSINGNTGTNSAVNFIGTTDNQALQFKINNNNAGKLATNNTAFGYNSGANNTAGTGNTFIGTGSDATINNLTNVTAIGNNAKVAANNSLVLGGTGVNIVKVGIGIEAPTHALTIVNDGVSDKNDDIVINTYSNTYTPALSLNNARGTAAAPVNLVNGDVMGSVIFKAQVNGAQATVSMIRSFYKGDGTNNAGNLQLSTSNQVRMHVDEVGNIGVGTLTPVTKLDINNGNTPGAVKIVDGSEGLNKVLTSDTNGLATWKEPAASIYYATVGAGVNIPSASTGYLYTGTTIRLPQGKWLVNVTMLLSKGTGAPTAANESWWVRSSFSDSNVTFSSSPDILGATLISGLLPGSSTYNLLKGSIVINNTSGAPKTYYYWGGGLNGGGNLNITGSIYLFGSSTWGENNIIYQAIN